MKLIVVTTPTFFVEEDKIITALFEEGLDGLHLRKPESSPVYSERLLTLIPKKYHSRIIIHQHYYLKDEFKLRGIHLNDENCNDFQDFSGHISCSCHSFEDVVYKKKYYDYVLMTPIYNNISKENEQPIYTSEDLQRAKKEKVIDSKVIALGGINADNILEMKSYGFGGVAIYNDLWDKFNPPVDENFSSIINHFRALRKLAE